MTVLRESPAGIISQKFLWLQFYLLFQCLAWGVKRNSVPLWRWKKSCLMLLAGFILLLSSMCKTEASVYAWVPYHDSLSGSLAGFLLDDFHCKIMRLCDIQNGCSVTLAKLSSAAVSMGFSSSAAFQTLLRFALGALLTGIYTSTESAWRHWIRERAPSPSNGEPRKRSCLPSVFLTEFHANHTSLIFSQ